MIRYVGFNLFFLMFLLLQVSADDTEYPIITPENFDQLEVIFETLTSQVAWSPNGEMVAFARHHVSFYDVNNDFEQILSAENLKAAYLEFSPDSKHIGLRTKDTFQLWDIETWTLLTEIDVSCQADEDDCWCSIDCYRFQFGFAPDNRVLVSTHRNAILVVDVMTGEMIETMTWEEMSMRNYDVNAVYSPNEQYMLSWDGLYQVSTDERIFELPDERDFHNCRDPYANYTVFSADGRYLALGGRSEYPTSVVLLYDLAIGDYELVSTWGNSDQFSYGACVVALSYNGSLLVFNIDGTTISFYDVPNQILLKNHTFVDDIYVREAQFSSDGRFLAIINSDNVLVYAVKNTDD